ncbi:sigma-70 family RNA polymerase sigma factor [Nocardioides immobilis]|uniref:Sigma-70 family RNA polymerase sigma factor n=1 Tax=Nocardioides immobilis TaxID=2049295 RepID=A0A417Y044_9ACTN|nr:sigma-70 family RNA polymerase sigma factor [Nocardioides immobilis]
MVGARGRTGEACPETVDVGALVPVVQRVLAGRVPQADAEDLVQETLARVIEAGERIDARTAEAYAITTARHLVARLMRDRERLHRCLPRLHDPGQVAGPDEQVVVTENRVAMSRVLDQLSPDDRDLLVAHEAERASLGVLAERRGATAAAVGARLHRLRSRLRVEYLLADEPEPPTERCRTVLLAFSARDRRRQRAADAEGHRLECDFCARVAVPLLDLDEERAADVRVPVRQDADIVAARRAVRRVAREAGLAGSDLTVLAAGVSEMARNVVTFADRGELLVERVTADGRSGVRVTIRDAGPGILDPERAMAVRYSTGDGLGLGLPGTQRLMDDFDLTTRPGRGTTVTMTKWRRSPAAGLAPSA